MQVEVSEDEVVVGLRRAGLPPDRYVWADIPQWHNDYGGSDLQVAYRAGYSDAQKQTTEGAQ